MAAKAKTQQMNTTGKSSNKQSVNKTAALLKKVAKIDKLPQNVRESIPIHGIMPNGIIETYPGTFTKSYQLQDVNFNIAPLEEQSAIFKNYMDLLNSFNEHIRWQFTIFNHEIDKKKTIEELRILPQRDGLNKYRQEMNSILLNNLKKGNNSIMQDKILTVAIDDEFADHAAIVFKRLDGEINKKIRNITKDDTKPMTAQERIKLLYSIYNQDMDYRLTTGIYDGKETFDLRFIEKSGLSVKDVIGPPDFDFTLKDKFTMGDTYGQAMYLERVPTYLSTSFLADIADIQCNMLISVTSEAINSEKAVKMVKHRLSAIEAQASNIEKRNGQDGYFGALPPDLERSQKNARELMNDITGRNQNLFYVTFTVVVFARTLEQLEENVKLVRNTAAKHLCPIKNMKFQQEFALNTSLPLCRNDLYVERMYTTESASVFIPYNSQEIKQKNAIFYGLNQVSKCMVLCDRTTGNNYNGLIFGYSGSGKSFTAKCEMVSVLLNQPNAQIFVIDPQGEYSPLAKAFHGQEIYLSPGAKVYINPLDLDISNDDENETDPVTMKSDFMISIFSIINGKNRQITPVQSSLIDKCVRKIYRSYIEELTRMGITCDISKCPTLSDLYEELRILSADRYEAGQLADMIYQYAVGSFDTFARRTNIKTNTRFVVYNIKNLGTGMKELGLHICMNDVWNRMIANSKKNIYTWFYIDEFHLLLESDGSTLFLKRIWKMARKWLGVPTGIMQNTEDLLRNADTRNIINNTSFIIMLREPLMDRQNLAELLNLSNAQLEYITNSNPGYGLIYNGKVTLPFGYDFPKNTELYRILTTSHDVKDAKFA